MIKADIRLVVQKNHYGVKKPRIASSGQLLTSSARKTKLNLKDLGFDFKTQGGDDGDSKKVQPSKDTHSTQSYSVSGVNPEAAVKLLNEVDCIKYTSDYLKKRELYLSKKEEVSKRMPKHSFEGTGRLTYFRLLREYAFDYYIAQYYVTVYTDTENGERKTTLSKKHYRLQPISEDDFNRKVEHCVSAFNKTEDPLSGFIPDLGEQDKA